MNKVTLVPEYNSDLGNSAVFKIVCGPMPDYWVKLATDDEGYFIAGQDCCGATHFRYVARRDAFCRGGLVGEYNIEGSIITCNDVWSSRADVITRVAGYTGMNILCGSHDGAIPLWKMVELVQESSDISEVAIDLGDDAMGDIVVPICAENAWKFEDTNEWAIVPNNGDLFNVVKNVVEKEV